MYDLSNSIVALGISFSILSIVSVLIAAFLTYRYIGEPIITSSNPYILFIILFGLLLGSITIWVIVRTPFVLDCRIFLWLIHFTFVCCVSTLAGKTWRIYVFFYFYKDRADTFIWTTQRLAQVFVGLPLFIVTIYLIIWSTVENWTPEYKIDSTSGEVIASCPTHTTFYTISYVIGIIYILSLVRLAFLSRKVPENFNESFWLGACVYTITILIVFLVPITLVKSISINAQRAFVVIAIFIALQSIILFIFWTKFAKIFGWMPSSQFEFYDSNKGTRNAESSNAGSKSNPNPSKSGPSKK